MRFVRSNSMWIDASNTVMCIFFCTSNVDLLGAGETYVQLWSSCIGINAHQQQQQQQQQYTCTSDTVGKNGKGCHSSLGEA